MSNQFQQQVPLLEKPNLAFYSFENQEDPEQQAFRYQPPTLLHKQTALHHGYQPIQSKNRYKQSCQICAKGFQHHLESIYLYKDQGPAAENGIDDENPQVLNKMSNSFNLEYLEQMRIKYKDDQQIDLDNDFMNNYGYEDDNKEPLGEGQICCPVCYINVYVNTDMQQFKCGHAICKMCLRRNIAYAIQNVAMIIELRCHQYPCTEQIPEDIIKMYSDDVQFEKYKKIKAEIEVVSSTNKKYCPTPGCDTIVNVPHFTKKIQCPKCNNHFCKDCGFNWHQGKSCKEVREEIFGEWADQMQANKCPKCKSRVEKSAGCQHMTCGFCKYEWCWICGLPYKSIFHQAQMGGLLCELIGGAVFKKNKCLAIVLMILLTVFLPVILLFFSCVLAAIGIAFVCEKLRITRCLKRIANYNGRYGSDPKIFRVIVKFLVIIFCVVMFCAYVAASGIVGVIMFAVTIAPMILIYLICLVMLLVTWRRKNMI